ILEGNANGAIAADRDPGAAVVTMAPGTVINSTNNGGAGSVDLLIDGNSNPTGSITLGTLNAGTFGVFVVNNGTTAGSGIQMASAADPITASAQGAQLYVRGNTTGSIGTAAAPLNLAGTVAATGQAGGVFLNAVGAITVGHTDLGSGNVLDGITTQGGGPISVVGTIVNPQPLTITSPITVNGGAGSITLQGGGQDFPADATDPVNIQTALRTPGGTVTISGVNGVTLSSSGSVSTGGGAYVVNADSDGG